MLGRECPVLLHYYVAWQLLCLREDAMQMVVKAAKRIVGSIYTSRSNKEASWIMKGSTFSALFTPFSVSCSNHKPVTLLQTLVVLK